MVSQSIYTDYTTVARVLSQAMFQDISPLQITAHDLSGAKYGIIRFQIDGNKAFPIPVSEFERILADLQSEDAPTYEIVGSFQRGPIRVDVVSSLTEGLMETRCCWTEPTLGEPVFVVQAKSGQTVRSDWKTKAVANNRWLKAYRVLWFQRNKQRNDLRDAEARKMAEREQDEIDFIRNLEAAMYD